MRITITGGGTGGHLSIAKALAQECKKQGFYTLYIGGTKGQDKQWFQDDKETFDEVVFLDSTPVVNQSFLGKFKALWQNIKESYKAKNIMKTRNIQACISVGGFSAATGSFGAIFGHIPLFIHEQNARMGSLNKLLKPFAKTFFSSFQFPNAKITPYPTNEIFFEKQRVRKELKIIAFFGGSQGAKAINEFALKVALQLKDKGIRIIHQTGKLEFESIKTKYHDIGIQTTSSLSEFQQSNDTFLVFDFSNQMPDIMEMSDFCISRAGASSLWESASNGLPTLFVPYPYAAKNHQYFNAKFLAQKGFALLCTQEQLDNYTPHKTCNQNDNNNIQNTFILQKNEDILSFIFTINLTHISQALIQNTQKNGAKLIINEIINSIDK